MRSGPMIRNNFALALCALLGGVLSFFALMSNVVSSPNYRSLFLAGAASGGIAAVFLGISARLSSRTPRRVFLIGAIGIALFAILQFFDGLAVPPEPVSMSGGLGASAETVRWGDQRYDVVKVPLDHATIRMLWKDSAGHPIGSLDAAAAIVGTSLAITNAGIFEPGQVPTGLLVAEGRELHALSLSDGEGNFFLKPNGVFYVGREGAGILESAEFAKAKIPIESATQSGPMLLRNGKLHHQISRSSTNVTIRSGVCVARSHLVYVVISREPVTFHALATFFRDGLQCTDGLYLDGAISEMRVPSLRKTTFVHDRFAGILVVDPRKGSITR